MGTYDTKYPSYTFLNNNTAGKTAYDELPRYNAETYNGDVAELLGKLDALRLHYKNKVWDSKLEAQYKSARQHINKLFKD